MFRKLFLDHPRSMGESYTQHAGFAAVVGFRMIFAGLACLLHGLFPFLFVRTGSNCIRDLHANLDVRRPATTTQPTVSRTLQTVPPRT
jgi:hypothetical protein